MATGKVIGKVEVSVGDVRIIGVDGVPREPAYGGTVYEGEQIISVDPEALFQVKYSALPEATAYDGLFRVLADGSVIAGMDVMDSLASDENLMDIFNLETAAGEEAPDGNSRFTPSDIVAESSVQGFGRTGGPSLTGLDGVNVGTIDDKTNDNAPTAEDAYNTAMEDNPNAVTGQLSGHDADNNPFHFVLVDGPSEGSLILLPDGRYIYYVENDFQDLGVGETRDVTFTFKTVETYTPEGYESAPATVTITVSGTNDQPEVDHILLTECETHDIFIRYDSRSGGGRDGNPSNDESPNTFGGLFGGGILHANDVDTNDNHIFGLANMEIDEDKGGKKGGGHDVYDGPSVFVATSGEGSQGGHGQGGEGGNRSLIEVDYDINGLAFDGMDGKVEVLFRSPDISAEDVRIDNITFWFNNDYSDSSAVFTLTGDFSALGAGEHARVTFKYYAVDDSGVGTDPANPYDESDTSEPKYVTITIQGTNDQPFVHSVSEELVETTSVIGNPLEDYDQTDVLTTFSGVLSEVEDDDVNDTHNYYMKGSASVSGAPGVTDLSVDVNSDGSYTMSGNFNALAVGQTATVSFKYYVLDDSGVPQQAGYISSYEPSKSEVKTVTLEVTGTNDAPEITDSTNPNIFNGLNGEYYGIGSQIHNLADFQAKILEKEPDATFRATNIDYGEMGITTHGFSNGDTYHVSTDESLQTFLKGDAHTLSSDPGNTSDGGVRLTGQVELDAGDYTFKILSDDGYQIVIDGTAVATMNANQSPQTNYHSFSVGSDGYHTIEIYWWDQGIEYIFQPELKIGHIESEGDYIAFSSENFNFTAEAAASVIEAGTTDSGVVVDGIPTVSGDLDATDEDNGAVLTWSVLNPSDTYGTFVIDPNTGTWTYTLNNDLAATEALNENQIVTEVFNVLVTDEHGATDTRPVVVEIQGTNDAPTLSVFGGDNLVVNGSFENPDISSGTWAHLATGVPGWIASDQVEIWDHLSTYGYDASDGEQHAELDYNGVVDTLSQTLNLVEGKFILSFDAATRDAATKDNAFIVLWNGVQIASIAEEDMHETDGTWKTFTFEVDAVDGANTLMFAEESSDNYGPLLDNIQLYAATSFNETTSGIVGNVVGDDVDAGAVLTYSLINDYGIFDIDSDGSIFVKDGQSLDYEVAQSYILDVKVTDQFDASATQSVKVDVNDITATVAGGEDVDLVVHTFNGHGKWSNEGWTGSGNESGVHSGSTPNGILGWFTQDGDTRSHDFTLNGAAGDTATISFTVGVHGDAEGYDTHHDFWHGTTHTPYGEGWEGNDALVVTVTGNDGLVAEETFYLDSNDEHMDTFSRSFDITVPNDGDIEVKFSSANTIDHGQGKESWFIDDFKIEGPEGDQIVSFENSSDGAIDMSELVAQANDFDLDNDTSTIETGIPDSVDEIDLSVGDHDLSNITLSDVISLSDADNVLKITGDSGDSVNDIATNGWIIDTAPSVTETGYDTYTNVADSSVQLLIDIDIPIDVD